MVMQPVALPDGFVPPTAAVGAPIIRGESERYISGVGGPGGSWTCADCGHTLRLHRRRLRDLILRRPRRCRGDAETWGCPCGLWALNPTGSV